VNSKRLEALANITTIFVSLLLSAVLVKVFLLPTGISTHASTNHLQAAKGTSLKESLPGVDWARNRRTLVLAISTKCHFCTESAPFFQRVGKERARDVKLLAVLPQPVDEARKYLQSEGVQVDDVRQTTLASIGVSGTPTLLLVDKSGTVSDAWQGKLPADGEQEVLAALRSNASK